MAELFEQFQDRTEAPTQKRRDQAAEEGRFALSQELLAGVVLLVGSLYLSWNHENSLAGFYNLLDGSLQFSFVRELNAENTAQLLRLCIKTLLQASIPLMGYCFAVALAVNVWQKGFQISADPLSPKLERLMPGFNLGKIWSLATVIKTVAVLAKTALVVGLAVYFLYQLFSAKGMNRISANPESLVMVPFSLLVTTAGCLFVLGLLDYAFQYWKHEQELKMTKQELQDETKENEGSPQVKSRQRKLHRELRQNGKLPEFEKATVVIKNPTHFAVALRYERGQTNAPVVVAKGRDGYALKLIAEAESRGIPVVENKPLAQSLFKNVRLGKEIPSELYMAVAQILAYIRRKAAGLAA